MLKKLYTVRDSKAGVYGAPMLFLSHGEAERAFKTAVNNSQTMYSQYPEDYDLFYLGDFDDVSGKMLLLDTPQHVVKAVNLRSESTRPLDLSKEAGLQLSQ